MAGSGAQAEQSLHESMAANRGKYLLVIEGAIPKAQNGIFCKVGGKTAVESLREAAPGAAAMLCIGTCSSFGGIQSVGAESDRGGGRAGFGHRPADRQHSRLSAQPV